MFICAINKILRSFQSIFFLQIFTGGHTKGKPTNSEFIALIADKLQLQLKSSEVANF